MSASRAGMIGTATIHGALIVAAFWLGRHVVEPTPPVYAIQLIAAPPSDAATPPTVNNAPPPVKAKDTAPILKPKKDAPKPPPKKAPEPAKPPVTKTVTPPSTPLPNQTPANGSDVANLKTEGMESKYPEYVNRITNVILASWYRSGPHEALTSEVLFTILPDGSTTDPKTGKSSGNREFDAAARAAIEVLGRQKAFGALPGNLPEMRVSYTFTPMGRP